MIPLGTLEHENDINDVTSIGNKEMKQILLRPATISKNYCVGT